MLVSLNQLNLIFWFSFWSVLLSMAVMLVWFDRESVKTSRWTTYGIILFSVTAVFLLILSTVSIMLY